MKEARIICPVMDNDGTANPEFLTRLRKRLAAWFGGYTETPGKGGWLNPDGRLFEDETIVFDIACDASEATLVRLKFAARRILREMRQEAVYVRYPDGNVEIISA